MCLSQVTFLWGSKYSLNGFYLAVYRSPRLSMEHIVYTQCFGMPCVAMWRTSPSSILFHSSPAFCHVFFTCRGLVLATKKMMTYMHLQRCLSLDPECAFKAKLCFGALWCFALSCEAVWECWKWILSYEKPQTRNMLNTVHCKWALT